jgi:arylsulfatase A-like enzyme
MGFDENWSHDNFYEMDSELSRNGKLPESFKGDSSEVIVDEALRFAEKVVNEQKPFFIVLWFGSPHDPYSGYPEDIEPYAALGAEISRRFAEITAMDRAIGTFRRGLGELGVRDNTLLWFNSDNGITKEGIPPEQHRHLFNAELSGNKSRLYEGGIRVPGIIEWPEIIGKPRTSAIPCVTSDILPTLLEVAGLEYPLPDRPLDGVSLKKLLVDNSMVSRPAIGFWGYSQTGERKNPSWLSDASLNEMITFTTRQKTRLETLKARGQGFSAAFKNHRHDEMKPENYKTNAAWIDGRFKLYVPKAGKSGRQTPELYDLEKDPLEQNDLANQNPERVKGMWAQLRQWQASVERSLTGADYP